MCRPLWRRGSVVLATGRSNKNDPNDASVGCCRRAAFSAGLHQVAPAGHGEVLRLLAKRNIDIGTPTDAAGVPDARPGRRARPGRIAKEINASDVERLLETLQPRHPCRAGSATTWPSNCLTIFAGSTTSSRAPTGGSATPVRASATSLNRTVRRRPRSSPGCSSDTPADIGRFASRTATSAYNGNAPGRVLFGRPGRASPLRAREPTAQPRHPHGRYLPAPPTPLRLAGPTSETAGQRGQDQQGKPSEPSSARSATPCTAAWLPTLAAPACSGPGRTDGSDSVASAAGPTSLTPALR